MNRFYIVSSSNKICCLIKEDFIDSLETSKKHVTKYWFCDVLFLKLKLVGLSVTIRIVSEAHVVYAFSKTESESVFILKHVWVGVEEDTVSQWNVLRSICLGIIMWDLRGAVGFSLSLEQR